MTNGAADMGAVLLLPVVAAALIDRRGRVLMQQRPPGKTLAGLWEFPGGKVERGESPEAALVRELDEELGIGVTPMTLTAAGFASEPLGDRHLLLLLYCCRLWSGEPRGRDGQALAWLAPNDLDTLSMPAADRGLAAKLRFSVA